MPNCGTTTTRPCAPVPTTAAPNYTPEEMSAYGEACYQKGHADAHHGIKAKLKEMGDSLGNALGEAKFGE